MCAKGRTTSVATDRTRDALDYLVEHKATHVDERVLVGMKRRASHFSTHSHCPSLVTRDYRAKSGAEVYMYDFYCIQIHILEHAAVRATAKRTP